MMAINFRYFSITLNKTLSKNMRIYAGNVWEKNIAIFLVFCFFSGQEEIRYPNGTLQISFADGSVKRIDTDGTENIAFPDGTKVIVHPNGDRTLLLPSGQKEIHTATFKVNFI